MKNKFAVAFSFIIVLSFFGVAQEEDSLGVESRISGALGVTQYYNDNILDYSAKDLSKFNNFETEYRAALDTSARNARLLKQKFSIDKQDDAITALRIRGGISTEFITNNPTTFRFRMARSLYAHSPIKNYTSFGFEARQRFLKKYYFSFGYSQLPEYYLRNLQYKDYSYPKSSINYVKNVQASLKKNSLEFEIGGNLTSKLFSSLQFDIEQTSYNREFEERNSTTNVFALDGSYKLTRAMKLNLDYTYSNAKADGSDNPDTNIADVTNYSHRFNAGAEVELKRATKLPLQWKFVVVYESQSYTSEKPTDKFHLGRKDNFYKIFTEIEYTVLKNINLSLNYFWEENTTNLEETSDAGSYQSHQVGLGVEYLFRF
ncbi:MAG: hypothetical protein HY960_01985 [Ignavibacteriae bacterium]|nr:hypothetical protein [Ignavibacteriota bacterium]